MNDTNPVSTTPPRPNTPRTPPPNPGTQSVLGQTKDVAQEAVSEAKEVGGQLLSQAKSMVTAQIGDRKTQSANDLYGVAQMLRQNKLENNMAAPLIGKAADQIDKVADYIRSASVSGVKQSLETFAKDEPLLFLGGAFTLGIFAARFLKSVQPTKASQP